MRLMLRVVLLIEAHAQTALHLRKPFSRGGRRQVELPRGPGERAQLGDEDEELKFGGEVRFHSGLNNVVTLIQF